MDFLDGLITVVIVCLTILIFAIVAYSIYINRLVDELEDDITALSKENKRLKENLCKVKKSRKTTEPVYIVKGYEDSNGSDAVKFGGF